MKRIAIAIISLVGLSLFSGCITLEYKTGVKITLGPAPAQSAEIDKTDIKGDSYPYPMPVQPVIVYVEPEASQTYFGKMKQRLIARSDRIKRDRAEVQAEIAASKRKKMILAKRTH